MSLHADYQVGGCGNDVIKLAGVVCRCYPFLPTGSPGPVLPTIAATPPLLFTGIVPLDLNWITIDLADDS